MSNLRLLLLTPLFLAAALHAEFRSAIAIRNVTPDPLLPVSGGVGASLPTNRKLGELTVRALVLESSQPNREPVRVAIVSSDFLGFPSILGDRVRAKVSAIPAKNILIGATHTHSAPDCYAFPDGKGGTGADLKYLDSVVAKMAEAINEAVDRLQPSALKIATAEAKGKIAYNYYAPMLYDPRCSVLQTIDASGKPIATLINYAIHPEVLGNRQGIVSPDLVGPLYDRIIAQGGGIGIFMNGAQGGMITADVRGPDGKDIQTWEECIRIGNLLADESLRIIQSAQPISDPPLLCTNKLVRFRVDSPGMQQIMKHSPLGYKTDIEGTATTTINLIHLANAQILTIPGEALPNIGYYLKRKMRGEHNLLFGLTNDAFGYILTKEDFGSFKRYEYVTRTSLGEHTYDTYLTAALDLITSASSAE
ncbi:MAG TPA: hypothetical protein VF773_03790 [Verrucomicrobiae bacterium]